MDYVILFVYYCFHCCICPFNCIILLLVREENEIFNVEDQQKIECIYDVVDHCGTNFQRSVRLTGRVVHSVAFRAVIVVAIFLDSLVVALETNATIVSVCVCVCMCVNVFLVSVLEADMWARHYKVYNMVLEDLEENIYIILIARVRVQYGKIFYEHAKYFHEPKASENVA